MTKKPKFRSPTLAALFDACVEQGWSWRYGRHIVLYPPNGDAPLILSITAYDGRENAKLVARAKRSGLRFP